MPTKRDSYSLLFREDCKSIQSIKKKNLFLAHVNIKLLGIIIMSLLIILKMEITNVPFCAFEKVAVNF